MLCLLILPSANAAAFNTVAPFLSFVQSIRRSHASETSSYVRLRLAVRLGLPRGTSQPRTRGLAPFGIRLPLQKLGEAILLGRSMEWIHSATGVKSLRQHLKVEVERR
jgi:hypothetical protein